MTGRTWFPTDSEAEEAVKAFFVVVPSEFMVVRCRVVGEVVARYFGIPWSWKLQLQLDKVMERAGAKRARFSNKQLWKRVQPRHFDVSEALALSNKLRGRKVPLNAPPEAA